MQAAIVVGAALVLAAASTGTTIPSLRALAGGREGGLVAGGFVAVHVAGGLVASALVARFTRRGGGVPVRALAVLALALSAALDAAMAAIAQAGSGPLLGLRFVEGATHVTAVMALMIAGAGHDAETRARRMTWLGMLLVVGLATGLLVGGRAAAGHPRLALSIGAGLAGLAAIVAAWGARAAGTVGTVGAAAKPVGEMAAVVPYPVALPALLVMGERFAFGLMTVALPMAALDHAAVRTTSTMLGLFMLASIAPMPIVRRLIARRGVTGVLVAALALMALALLVTPFIGRHLAIGLGWALVGGAAAAAIYTAGLVLVAGLDEAGARLRGMAFFHALGGAGHALGSLVAGVGVTWLPASASPAWLVAVPGAIMVLTCGALAARRLRG